MADDEIFTATTGQGLVVSTGILGDLVFQKACSILTVPTRSATSPPRASGTVGH